MPLPSFQYFEPAVGRSCIELFTARTDDMIADVADVITGALASHSGTRSIIEDTYQLHFHKAVSSRVQLTAAGNGRIGIRIDYNPKNEQTIVACVARLATDGSTKLGDMPHNKAVNRSGGWRVFCIPSRWQPPDYLCRFVFKPNMPTNPYKSSVVSESG